MLKTRRQLNLLGQARRWSRALALLAPLLAGPVAAAAPILTSGETTPGAEWEARR